jgi:hypothetical protein
MPQRSFARVAPPTEKPPREGRLFQAKKGQTTGVLGQPWPTEIAFIAVM